MIPLESRQYLDSFINHEIHLDRATPSSFKLERVRQLLKNLGDPQKDLNVIHVAGSKGKGSICALTASVLKQSGYTVGLYTSPHINNYRERIRVLSWRGAARDDTASDIFPDAISEEDLCSALEEIKPEVEKTRARKELGSLSFFEVYTALALHYFRKRETGFVVLETGVGGRLDATNAADSLVAVVAPVSLEHTRLLGETVARIALEKAGIIKSRGQKVVLAPQSPEARDVLENRCRAFGIDPWRVEERVKCAMASQDFERQIFDVTTPKAVYQQLVLPLLGKHQRDNAAAVIGVTECLGDLGFPITESAVGEGFKNVFWPGRFEIAGRDPLVILDGAHNGASAGALAETAREILGGRKAVLVFGVCEDKDQKTILKELAGIARDVILTKAGHPRARDFEGAVDVRRALEAAYRRSGKGGVILVAGSIFVVGEVRRIIKRCVSSGASEIHNVFS